MEEMDSEVGESIFSYGCEGHKRQKALLLHYGGSDLSDIHYTLQSEDDIEFKHGKIKLDAYFEPKVNITFETYIPSTVTK